jgi:hypothetical protein
MIQFVALLTFGPKPLLHSAASSNDAPSEQLPAVHHGAAVLGSTGGTRLLSHCVKHDPSQHYRHVFRGEECCRCDQKKSAAKLALGNALLPCS